MKRNFNELFSKMKPEAQERVKARSSKLLQEIDLAARFEEIQGATESEDAASSTNATASDDANAERGRPNRKVAMQGSK